MKNKELLLTIIQKNASEATNEFKNNCLNLATESIPIIEAGEILDRETSEILAFFWAKGQIIKQNQLLDLEELEKYCQSIGVKVKKKSGIEYNKVIQEYLEKISKDNQLVERPPIVSIMGHIDHGKTTLLDTIVHYSKLQQSSFQSREAGGITQKISTCQIEFLDKKIIFLDTPGHSDFIKMRQRGISLTDLVVLVIDARDGIMPQTEEIINYLHEYELPVITFINHKNLSETNNEINLNRIKSQLQERDLTPPEWGGEETKASLISGSAKEVKDIENLLEKIILSADFKAPLQTPVNGMAIDSYLDSKSHLIVNKLLIQGGKLSEKDIIFLNGKFGKAKIIFDISNQRITTAYPGSIVNVIGLTTSAEIGDRFLVIENEDTQIAIEKELANFSSLKNKLFSPTIGEKKSTNLILLADTQNSLEALNNLVEKKNRTVNFKFAVVWKEIGKLNNLDLITKITSSTLLVFGLSLNKKQIKTLKENNISFFQSKIIYKIEEKLEEIVNSQQEVKEVKEIEGKARIKKIFKSSDLGNIAGCQVINGKINRNSLVEVWQGKEKKKIFSGEIKGLESKNERKSEVISGQECGIVLKGFDNFQEGDEIVAFRIVKQYEK